jgi:hypothetical protein
MVEERRQQKMRVDECCATPMQWWALKMIVAVAVAVVVVVGVVEEAEAVVSPNHCHDSNHLQPKRWQRMGKGKG